MGAFLHFHICWVGSQDLCDQIPTHFFDPGADVDIVFLESVGLAEIVTVTG